MENWTINELLKYQIQLVKNIRVMEKDNRWYHSRKTKVIRSRIYDRMINELDKVNNIILSKCD